MNNPNGDGNSGNSNGYRSSSQQHLITVIQHLGQSPLHSHSLADIVDALPGSSRDQAFRALKNLEIAGWAEQRGGGWRLTPALTQLSERLRCAIADLHRTYLTREENLDGG